MTVFRYKEEPIKGIKRPVADVFLQHKSGSWIKFHPYIDSGADVTLIPLTFGKLIGLTVDAKRIEQIGGIKGSVPVMYHKLKMRIGTKELLVHLGWALIEEVPPLLGRADVFDIFDVTFKQSKGIILFDERT